MSTSTRSAGYMPASHISSQRVPQSARERPSQSWPVSAVNDQRNARDTSQDTVRRWSADGMRKSSSDRHNLARSYKPTSKHQTQHHQLTLTSAQRKASPQYDTHTTPRLWQSQSSDALNVSSLSPMADARRLSASPLRSVPNSPLVLDAEDWSFLHDLLESSTENAPALPRSPLSGHRPTSRGTIHDSSARSPLSRVYGRDSWQGHIEDEGLSHGPITPPTARPASAALDTIIEGASVDHDVSLAETSVFGFDRYRFSSISPRSEPTGTSPRSSPVPATQSGVPTGRTSRASSVLSDASSHGATGGFKPKPLILRRPSRSADPAAQASSRLSRSFSVPMLMLETTPTDGGSRLERPGQSRSETVGSPSSGREYLTPTPTFDGGICSAPSDASRPDSQTVDQPRVHRASKESPRSTSHCTKQGESFTPRKHAPATINVSGPSNFAEVVAENEDAGDSSQELRLPINVGSSTLSPIGAGTNTTPRKSQSSSDTDPDQSLRSDSLSPPRSAASAETQSSGTIELVPWQVATTDSTGPRRSEEIFRPLSMALSMSRSGAGSSRDTITSRTARRAAVAEAGSRRSTMQMPATPLKGGTDFIWGRPEYEARSSRETAEVAAAAGSRRPSHVGLGISVPRPCVGLQQSNSPYPDVDPAPQSREAQTGLGACRNQLTESKGSSAQDYRISSPPGAMKRLLFELEHGSTDSQLAPATQQQEALSHDICAYSGTGAADASTQHQRSATLSSISILPRTSSMRRRHQSIDVDGRQSSVQASGLGTVAGLDALIEHPRVADVASKTQQQRKAVVEPRHHAEVERREHEANVPKSNLGRAAKRAVESSGPKIALELYTIIYQALFFTFEAPYLWTSISPALPLVAAALCLILDTLVVQMHLFKGEQMKLLLSFSTLLSISMAYCSAMCTLKVVLLTRTDDLGASSPGIHFHRNRSPGGNAFQQVLRDMPMSAVLILLGIIGISLGLFLTVAMTLSHRRRRGGHPS